MDIFTYEPLDLGVPGIRLLRLFQGSGSGDIKGELFQAWLHGDGTIPFEALSYTWGEKKNPKTMTLNGKKMEVTQNLFNALRSLRLPHQDRVLWVDAVCIDQQNDKERGHQVQQMGDIYTQADQVIVWLGLSTNATDILMESLMLLQKESRNVACANWESSDVRWRNLWLDIQPIAHVRVIKYTTSRDSVQILELQRKGLRACLKQSWFRRIWILQEVANAKAAVVQIGSKSVSARFIALAPSLIKTNVEPHCQAVLDMMPGPSRKYSWWSKKRDLYSLLTRFRRSEASDERDKIYALMGMATDPDKHELKVDYTRRISEVVDSAHFYLFGISSSYYPGLDLATFLSSLPSPPESQEQFSCRVVQENNLYFLSQLYNPDFRSKELPQLIVNAKRLIRWTPLIASPTQTDESRQLLELLNVRRRTIEVTEKVLEIAAQKEQDGEEIMKLLLEHRKDDVKINERVLHAAAKNKRCGKGIIIMLLKCMEWKPESCIPEGRVSSTLIARSWNAGMTVLLAEGIPPDQWSGDSLPEYLDHLLQRPRSKERKDGLYIFSETISGSSNSTFLIPMHWESVWGDFGPPAQWGVEVYMY